MTTLKPYLCYKDSSVDWLGNIPTFWDIVQLARLADEKKVRNGGLRETTVLSLSYGRIIVKKDIFGGLSPADYSTYQIVEPGNVILRLTDLHNDQRSLRVGLAEHRGIITSAYGCLKPSDFMETRFLYRMLHDFDVKKMFYGMGAGVRQGLSYGELRKTAFAVPPLDEQRAIADFLDGMDARITRFIAARWKMIALLEEKKQAVVNQAVTRGLGSNVPMKDSGVDWLGEIPAHWELRKLKTVTSHIVDCLHATPIYEADGQHPAIRTSDVIPGKVIWESARRVSTDEYNRWTYRLRPNNGDILYSREGDYGIAAPVPKSPRLCISQRMMVFRPNVSIDSQFLMWQLNSTNVLAQASVDADGSTVPHVNISTIRNYNLTIPPLPEQRDIAAHIDHETSRIDALIIRHRQELGLMQEYRTRLISDVVTGKLDVRGVELPAVEAVIGEEIEAALEEADVDELRDELEEIGV